MATWANLDQEDRDAIASVLSLSRDFSGMLARLANLGLTINAAVGGDITAFLSGLNAGDIPVYDAASGEQVLSKADLINIVGYAQAISNTGDNVPGSYNSNFHRSLFVRAAGPYNTLQQGS